ncbi:formylglycine-generating enzyme family protein [Aquirufa sp.]|uniref:formylglycine-generating enzyme family protein n=1 Tax=Aquirufa sp. TaxID=2676249 RepID=UPI003783EC5D
MRRLVFSSLLFSYSLLAQDLKSYQQVIPQTRVSFDMVAIPSGSFVFGQTKKTQVSAFWMGKTEVTYDEYQLFFEESRDPEPRPPKEGPDAVTRPSPPYIDFTLGMGKVGGFPANSMQQYGAIMYCKWLYAKTGVFYRLPTEIEWEYACKAGAEIPSKDLADYAWFQGNSNEKYHQVGQKKPNAWGLHDMLGNVSEWVLDHFESDPTARKDSPVFIDKYADAVVRGGNYQDPANLVRSTARMAADPIWNRRDPQVPKSIWWNADAPFVGFRIMRPAKQPSATEINSFFEKYLN